MTSVLDRDGDVGSFGLLDELHDVKRCRGHHNAERSREAVQQVGTDDSLLILSSVGRVYRNPLLLAECDDVDIDEYLDGFRGYSGRFSDAGTSYRPT